MRTGRYALRNGAKGTDEHLDSRREGCVEMSGDVNWNLGSRQGNEQDDDSVRLGRMTGTCEGPTLR